MHEAEFALGRIADAFHGSGLGTHLLRRLVQIAKGEGCLRIIGYILPGNRPMLHLRKLPAFDAFILWAIRWSKWKLQSVPGRSARTKWKLKTCACEKVSHSGAG